MQYPFNSTMCNNVRTYLSKKYTVSISSNPENSHLEFIILDLVYHKPLNGRSNENINFQYLFDLAVRIPINRSKQLLQSSV